MIITKTPLRLSFFGGATDIANFYSKGYGAVLTTSVAKYIYVCLAKSFHENIKLGYTKVESVPKPELLEHELIRTILIHTGIMREIEIFTMADIPSTGTGLGSSSSLAVGVLNSVYAYKGVSKSKEELADEASHIEIDVIKKPIGKQDQYAAALGGLRYLKFNSDGSVETKKVNIPSSTKKELSESLISFYIQDHERSGDNVLRDQNTKLQQNFETLEKMRDQASIGLELLNNGNLHDFGKLMGKAWDLKRSLSSMITNPTIDNYYQLGVKNGALGGKISGAGGSGFLTFFCEPKHQDKVRAALKGLREMNLGLDEDGTKLVYKD